MVEPKAPNWVEKAFHDGHLQLIQSGRTERIRYVASNTVEGWSDSEEKVRAAYYAELIYRYGYAPEYLGVEVTVPDRVPHDRADIVVFRDKAHTKPFAVIECKRDGVTDTEFKQAIEQAFGNGHAHKFRADYIGVIAGQTRAFYDCSDRFGVLEREANIIADLPTQYGKPEEFKYYYQAQPKPDIAAVGRDDLIKTIRKCHQTLWGGGRLSPPTAFGELCKLIFVKTRDEKKDRKKGEPYARWSPPVRKSASRPTATRSSATFSMKCRRRAKRAASRSSASKNYPRRPTTYRASSSRPTTQKYSRP